MIVDVIHHAVARRYDELAADVPIELTRKHMESKKFKASLDYLVDIIVEKDGAKALETSFENIFDIAMMFAALQLAEIREKGYCNKVALNFCDELTHENCTHPDLD